MALIADLTLSDPLFFVPTFDAVPEARCRFEDVHYITEETGWIHYVLFGWVDGCDYDAFDRALGQDQTVADFRQVTAIEDRRLYRIETRRFPPDQPLVFPYFRELDTTAIATWRTANGLELTARFPDRTALKAFLETARSSIAEHVSVDRLYAESSEVAGRGLTDKQREALTLALRRGYFETPSRTNLEALADELGVTPQTLSRHIRMSVKAAVTDAVGPSGRPRADRDRPVRN